MTLPVNTVVDGTVKAGADIARAKIAQDVLAIYPIKLTDFRVWDAMHTVLPGTSATDDLALISGTFGTNTPMLKTYDVKAAGSQFLRARCIMQLPPEYDGGETVTMRVSAGVETTVADVSASIDVEVYESDKAGGVSADLISTAAQSCNSLTLANKDFTVTPTGLLAGDWLDIRITMAMNDAATGTAVLGVIGTVDLLCDIRG